MPWVSGFRTDQRADERSEVVVLDADKFDLGHEVEPPLLKGCGALTVPPAELTRYNVHGSLVP